MTLAVDVGVIPHDVALRIDPKRLRLAPKRRRYIDDGKSAITSTKPCEELKLLSKADPTMSPCGMSIKAVINEL